MTGPLPIRRRLSPQCIWGGVLVVGAWLAGSALALSPLAPAPAWAELEPFQQTITRAEFVQLLDGVYAPGGAARDFIDVQAESAVIKISLNPPVNWTLHFAPTAAEAKPAPRAWRTPREMGVAPPGKPLAGVKIAIDPGHLGGTWARMEQRFLQVGESRPVAEGDMTLRVAGLLQGQLEALGAQVTLVRPTAEPVTPERPATLQAAAAQEMASGTSAATHPLQAVADESELLFYRTSEIRHRAQVVNERIRPDLTLCLHFNAEAWGDPQHPDFVPRNHLHVLLNGSYAASELRQDDVRFEMLLKLLSRCYPQELAAGTATATSLAAATGLPAYNYTTPNAVRVSADGYLWARNLLANRLYRTPVVFFEPFVMNNELVWERVQAGDYDGEILLGGVLRPSIYREYAGAVAAGLREYYLKERTPGESAALPSPQ